MTAASPVEAESGSPIARRVGLVLGPALFLLLLFGPDLGLDPLQRRVAAVTAVTAVLWLTVALPVGATSLLPAVLFPALGVLTARDAAASYMSDLVQLFLGAFVVALGVERWGVHRRIALAVIARVGTRPRNLVLGFMIAAAFLSMWINNTATTLMMLPIGVAVIESIGGETGEEGAGPISTPFAIALLLGIGYSSSIGGMATPVGTAPNQVLLGQFQERFPDAPAISFGQWISAWLPLVVLFVFVAWLVLTRVALRIGGPGRAGAEQVREERAKLGPMGAGARRMAWVFLVTAVLWVTRADLELGSWVVHGWSDPLQRLLAPSGQGEGFVTDATVALGMAVVCFLIPVDRLRGTYLMDWKTAARMPWDVLLLIGSGFCIALAFRESGLDEVLGAGLAPLVLGQPTWLVVGAVVLLLTFLTEITSNTATTNVLLPVLAQASVEAEIHPLILMAPATIAASAAFMLPVATPPNAVVYASHRVPIPTMARVGLVLNLISVVLVTLVFEGWVRRVWQIGSEVPEWARP